MARGRAGDLVVLGPRADSQFPLLPTLGPGTRHGGGLAPLDVLRIFLARVSRAVPAERADALGGAEQVLRLGTGSVVPGLEQGLQGAKKNEIRRIIVPSNLGYSETTDLEPVPPTIEDKRALDSVLRNPRRDAALLFDVKILRVK